MLSLRRGDLCPTHRQGALVSVRIQLLSLGREWNTVRPSRAIDHLSLKEYSGLLSVLSAPFSSTRKTTHEISLQRRGIIQGSYSREFFLNQGWWNHWIVAVQSSIFSDAIVHATASAIGIKHLPSQKHKSGSHTGMIMN